MAGDIVHHLYLGEFSKAYPEAKVIGVEGLAAKKKKEGLTLAGGTPFALRGLSILTIHVAAYGVDPEDTKYGFEDEVSLTSKCTKRIPDSYC